MSRLPNFMEYKRETRAQIARLQARVDQEMVRAELAERRERSLAAEMEIWKHRAHEAEAALRSSGVVP
jgi:hypothetical protein